MGVWPLREKDGHSKVRTDKTGNWTAKIICAILSVMLLFTLVPATAAAAADYSVVRVKLTVGTIQSLTITVDGNYTLKEKPSEYIYRKNYTVKISGTQIGLYDGSAQLYSGASFTLVQNEGTGGENNFIKLKNDKYSATLAYLGDLEFKSYAMKKDGVVKNYIKVINHVYIEDYLYGVVPHEMSNSFPLEALKAQAIFARGYAVRSIDTKAEYDLVDTSSDQVYKGFNAANNNAIEAVNATKFKVLKYDGGIVSTYFSASNGGEVEVTNNIWTASTPKPYQVVKEDPYDTRNTSTPSEKKYFPVNANDSTSFPALDKIKSTYIKPQLISGGYVDKDGEAISITSDFSLKTLVSMTGKVPAAHTKFKDYNCACTHVESVTMKVIAGTYQKAVDPATNAVTLTPADVEITFTIPVSKLEDWGLYKNTKLEIYQIIEKKNDAGALEGYYVRHARYGHGAGLSQRGAQQMAKEGIAFTDILAFYYPNTTVEAAPIAAPALSKRAEPGVNGVVTADTDLRSGADSSSGVLEKLKKDQKIYVVQPFASGDWHKVVDSGFTGYVFKDAVSFVSVAAVAGGPTGLKAAPGADSADVAVLGPDVNVEVQGTEGDFSKVAWNGIIAYVPTAALKASAGTKPAIAAKGTASAAIVTKAGPGDAYSNFVNIAKDASVEVVQKDIAVGWHMVWAAGNIAYVPSSAVAFVVKPSITGLATASATLTVRSGPGTSYGKLGTMKKSSRVEVVKKDYKKDWHQVWYNSRLAYVQKKYVSVSSGSKAAVAVASDIKASASSSAGKVLSVAKGKTLKVYYYSGSYAYVNYSGKTGYFPKSALSPASPSAKPAIKAYAYIASDFANVRSSSSTAAAVIGKITKGKTVEIVAKNFLDQWHQIWNSSKYGYVHASNIKLYSTKSGTVNTSSLSIRASASSSAKVLKKVARGKKLVVLEKGSKWHKVYYGGVTGYVTAKYVKVK
jgi:stage II sporulation protein D